MKKAVGRKKYLRFVNYFMKPAFLLPVFIFLFTTPITEEIIAQTTTKSTITVKVNPELAAASFKKAVLDVFTSYKESNFYSIKSSLMAKRNFWNYEFTYVTKLKIPGEKFNMLYSFPFLFSPLDFVSVIKEADGYDGSFQTTYKDFEKKLLKSFPASDGWVASCIPNKESKTLSDLEFTNEDYGSIILDYSVSPRGKHILYLRFLLYST